MPRIRLKCASPNISIPSRHPPRRVPVRRSAYPFCQGDLGEIGRSRIPMALSREVSYLVRDNDVPLDIGADC